MSTPARKQYLRIKREHPNAILLFRMGDFYETFDDDASIVSQILDIALTSREMGKGQRIPLAGIPYHSLDSYLGKLVREGHKVAICEQTSDSTASKGIVDREVVRVVTPGTVVEDSILDIKTNNYLSSVIIQNDMAGFAYVDITTSEFHTTEIPIDLLAPELDRLSPAELIVIKGQSDDLILGLDIETYVESSIFDTARTKDSLLKHFKTASLESFGCEHLELAIRAAGAIIHYLDINQKTGLQQITSLDTYSAEAHMILDPQTKRNLGLFEDGRWNEKKSSLLTVLDKTKTGMGSRLLRRWIGQPLLDLNELKLRLDSVSWLADSVLRREQINRLLGDVSDLERLINRIRSNSANPRDLIALCVSLRIISRVKSILDSEDSTGQINWLGKQMSQHLEIVNLLDKAIVQDPPVTLVDGGVIEPGFSKELDSLRNSSQGARDYIGSLENKEKERLGIKSLKVGFNKVFGYYIEISNSNINKVPDNYIRRQTLVGGERYITSEMKDYESQILNANERITELETRLFHNICNQVSESATQILSTANAISKLDVFVSFAEQSARSNYVRPELNHGDRIDIYKGRHPVVETTLDHGAFVPNDVRLSNSDEQLIILTGPNMAGKSTYLRQSAIITLMAQIGSFVPAESASIGLVDRIFTRVGLQDDLAMGQSTFMVEMTETAYILNQATSKSFIILDEIGRGTSTYDGLAIAKSVAEHIHNSPKLGCKTLFATHYHELIDLEDVLPRARNYNVSVSENKGEIVFLRHIVRGGSDRSYGIHVARLAGLPNPVINRAWEILSTLEEQIHTSGYKTHDKSSLNVQLSLMDTDQSLLNDILSLDVDALTPLQSIIKLFEIQEMARKKRQ
tara:strand:+ start:1673 stop:4249 length:2577 start_codon:yes stop_codon:yes gene_type:complete